ncbi:MAG: Hint domain-containing protein [Rhodobacteraceae bacterium]|nr:Hint domain-containing protein [Paracoccaceae bacterium]
MFMQNATDFRAAEKISLSLHGLNILPDFGASGLLAGSLVETERGWRPVETLARGARIATYDGGFCPVTRVERHHVWPAAGAEVIHVPGGALDNCSDFSLLPGQHLLVTSQVAEEVLDCAGALIPASALVGYRGITRQGLVRPAEVLSLRFAAEEVVYVNSGALIHCAADGPEATEARSAYFEVLDEARAQAMLALIAAGAMTSDGLVRAA